MNQIDFYLFFICAGGNAQMRKRVFRHLCLYFSTNSRVIQNIDAQWKPKKLSRDKNFTFSFAHAEMRKRVFLNFLRYLRTDFEAVTEYVFGMIVRLICSVNLFIHAGGNMLAQMRKRVFSLYFWYLSTDLNAVFCIVFVINCIIMGGEAPRRTYNHGGAKPLPRTG